MIRGLQKRPIAMLRGRPRTVPSSDKRSSGQSARVAAGCRYWDSGETQFGTATCIAQHSGDLPAECSRDCWTAMARYGPAIYRPLLGLGLRMASGSTSLAYTYAEGCPSPDTIAAPAWVTG